MIHQALAGGIDVVDLVGQVPEIPAARIGSGSQLYVSSTCADSSPGRQGTPA